MTSYPRLIWKTVITGIILVTICYIYLHMLFADDLQTMHFSPTQCSIQDKKLNERNATSPNGNVMYQPLFFVSYTVDDKAYEEWTYNIHPDQYSVGQTLNQAIFNAFDVGSAYPCWYDPKQPSTVVLSRLGNLYFLPLLAIPVILFIYLLYLVIRLIFRSIALLLVFFYKLIVGIFSNKS